MPTPTRDTLIRAALRLGLLVPVLYYGIQLAAAPFYPDFSFVGTTASELGSDRSRYPALFNVGILSQGVVTLVVAIGFLFALRRLAVPPIFAWPTAAALAMNGVQTLWAGWFPMPDPRHGGHPAFLVAMLSLPVLLTLSVWRRTASWGVRGYFVVSLVLLAAMVPVMSGVSGLDTNQYRGLIQRVFTLTIFPPITVAACVLAKRRPSERRRTELQPCHLKWRHRYGRMRTFPRSSRCNPRRAQDRPDRRNDPFTQPAQPKS